MVCSQKPLTLSGDSVRQLSVGSLANWSAIAFNSSEPLLPWAFSCMQCHCWGAEDQNCKSMKEKTSLSSTTALSVGNKQQKLFYLPIPEVQCISKLVLASIIIGQLALEIFPFNLVDKRYSNLMCLHSQKVYKGLIYRMYKVLFLNTVVHRLGIEKNSLKRISGIVK